ncbi:MAG: adenylosuccinate lyase [Dethiobacter sp.]|nr:MAG: adenylosuccinate lyase [Dethiobacter sp.]
MIERYSRPEMGRIWTLENRFKKFLEIEIAVCYALAQKGIIPREAAEAIEQKASFSVERILEIEETTRHDVVAFTRCVAESLGEESRYFHYGLTSYDIVDTALSLLLKEAIGLIDEGLANLAETLKEQALKHQDTVMIGRTHGVHAEPITLGLKFALWWDELRRHRERLKRAEETISCGKISGAVGTYAHLDPWVEEAVCQRLGLKPAPISTQILQRDLHAEFLTVLALLASSLDKFAVEIRGLQKTEIRELEEPFYQGQKGSSAMPHKRNPVSSEQISGLSRIVRANAQVALENIPLWHERDISHSSAERVILPDSSILIDYMLYQMNRIIRNLHVYPRNMLANLEKTGGLVYSQSVLLALVEKGMSREKAYDLVQKYAMRSWEEQLPFRQLLENDREVISLLTPEEIKACFDTRKNLRFVSYIFRRLGLIQ